MRKHLGCVVPALCAGLVLVCTVSDTSPALAAPDCLAGPNGPSPKGQHWYYRIDRPTGRKCWYLGQLGQRARQAAPMALTAPTAPAARIKPAEPPRQTQAAISPESEVADPEIWPKAEPAPLRTAGAAAPVRIAEAAPPVSAAMETPRPVEASRPVPPAPAPEPPPIVTADPSPQPAMPAQASTSSTAKLSLVLLIIGMAIIGFLARTLYRLSTRGRLRVEGGSDRDLIERPRFFRAIASPTLAPEDSEPRIEDMLRRLPRRSERRVA